MTGLWVLVVVVGTLTFLGNNLYDTEEDCNQDKQIVESDVSTSVCAPLDGMLPPSEDKPETN